MSPRQDPQRPTVGDTLTIVHRVVAPDGALVQPRGPTDSTLATLVGTPEVRREGDSVRIAYTVAVWSPGRRELVIPGPIVVRGSGAIDTLPDARVTLDVASVLPERVTAESIAPRAARPWVERASASLLPLAALLVPVALALAALALWWRRRGRLEPLPPPPSLDGAARIMQLGRWLDAGEATLAVDHIASMLPAGEQAEAWRQRVAAVRFAPDGAERLAILGREGLRMLEQAGER